jgi:aspartyl-tRNA(Asn)/glutamyl-tRNA(Gln) amidotransferase subunit C
MKIGTSEVEYVARLAHLAITEEEKSLFVDQLNSILEYVEKLNTLDTSDVPPTAQVASGDALSQPLRPDELRNPFFQDLALANGPSTGAGHFKVPKVIER